jgi:hypothetical protein
MNSITVTFLFLICQVQAFQVHQKIVTFVPKRTALQMGFFDFKPIHGSGSARPEDLEEQYQIQQQLVSFLNIIICPENEVITTQKINQNILYVHK